MDRDLVEVASYGSRQEARQAKSYLATHGIFAAVAGGSDAPPSDNDLVGVAISVSREDIERTAEIFASPEGDAYAGSWNCRQCGESVIVRFTICWRCGATRDGQRNPSFRLVDVEENEEFNSSENTPLLLGSDDAAGSRDPREPSDNEPAWTCIQCNRRVAAGASTCWNCGTSREGVMNPYHSPATIVFVAQTAQAKIRPDEAAEAHLLELSSWAFRTALLGIIVPLLPTAASFYNLLKLKNSPYKFSPTIKVEIIASCACNAIGLSFWLIVPLVYLVQMVL